MAHPRYSSREITERGQALFEREIRPRLDASADGKFVAVDVETGDYEMDSSELEALKRARNKRPDAALYLLRVGSPAAYRLGRQALSAPSCSRAG